MQRLIGELDISVCKWLHIDFYEDMKKKHVLLSFFQLRYMVMVYAMCRPLCSLYTVLMRHGRNFIHPSFNFPISNSLTSTHTTRFEQVK